MAVQDIRSNLISQFMGALTTVNDSSSILSPGVIDTAAYELGVMFSFQLTADVGDGNNTAVIQESDLPTTGFTPITNTDQLIGSGILRTTPTSPVAAATGTGTIADPFVITENRFDTLGVISNKRFLKISITNLAGTDTATYDIFVIQKAEDMPTVEPANAF